MLDVLAILTSVVALAFWRFSLASPVVRRVTSALGVASIASLVFLGAIWPSAYTLAALVALPGAFYLGAAVLRPDRLDQRAARVYALASLSLPPLSFAFQLWWVHGLCEALGRCAPAA